MRESMRVVLLTLCTWLMAASAAHATELQWWSHWAIEDNKKLVLFEAKRRFEAKNPGHTVTITFYEKKNMFTTLRAAFAAGSGFPDVVYYDIDAPEFMAAGWLADLSTGIRWENIEPFGKAFWTRPGPGARSGSGRCPSKPRPTSCTTTRRSSSSSTSPVPAGARSPRSSSRIVVAQVHQGRLRRFATGAADRDWAAHYMPNGMLLDKLGPDDTLRLFKGELSWKDPRVVEVFHYYKELIDLGAYSKSLSSMTLAEAHRYFHTEQKACMFPVGSWYTGRAFVAPDKGGQPKDFELGMMNYPLMKDGKGHNQKFLGVAGSLGAAAKGPNLPLAIKVVDSFADVEIGNLWMAKTGVQTGIKTDVSKIDSPFKWYFDEYARVNKATKWVDLTAQQVRLADEAGRVGHLRGRE